MNNIVEFVTQGIDDGLVVRGFEDSEDEEGVLQRTQVFKVEKAREVLHWVKNQYHELETFSDEEHDFRRMKGILARITTPNKSDKPFYIAKALPAGNVMSARTSWMVRSGKFTDFDADAAVKVPTDNQLLILDQDIYVFNQSKLKQLFAYDAKEAAIAEKKVEEIHANFNLSFAEGLDLQTLVMGKKSIIKKLQKIDPSSVKQQQIIDYADELGIELLTDDTGSILITESKDLVRFVNLLNDDYLESGMTGERYEIVRKKVLRIDENEE